MGFGMARLLYGALLCMAIVAASPAHEDGLLVQEITLDVWRGCEKVLLGSEIMNGPKFAKIKSFAALSDKELHAAKEYADCVEKVMQSVLKNFADVFENPDRYAALFSFDGLLAKVGLNEAPALLGLLPWLGRCTMIGGIRAKIPPSPHPQPTKWYQRASSQVFKAFKITAGHFYMC